MTDTQKTLKALAITLAATVGDAMDKANGLLTDMWNAACGKDVDTRTAAGLVLHSLVSETSEFSRSKNGKKLPAYSRLARMCYDGSWTWEQFHLGMLEMTGTLGFKPSEVQSSWSKYRTDEEYWNVQPDAPEDDPVKLEKSNLRSLIATYQRAIDLEKEIGTPGKGKTVTTLIARRKEVEAQLEELKTAAA